MSDHVTTIVNASTLLSSVSKVILSKFKRNETTVVEALVAVNCLTNTVQRMKFLLLEKDLKVINQVGEKKKRIQGLKVCVFV